MSSLCSERRQLNEHSIFISLLIIFSLDYTESVFRKESGHGELKMSRQTLCQTLQLRPVVNVKALRGLNSTKDQSTQPDLPVDRPIPLLCYLIGALKERDSSAIQSGESSQPTIRSGILDTRAIVPNDCKSERHQLLSELLNADEVYGKTFDPDQPESSESGRL
ncbi:unnamed protein product [Echinostoma caproni]|uniref:Uncharacterized protein n=1 Tax=Echinostoma caproni TaxID=27848 RepID=A0A183ATU5_9TREM|nr:unnamed protein product [Echinostoma caproni]